LIQAGDGIVKHASSLLSWAFTVAVFAACIWACHWFSRAEESRRAMRNAASPARMFLEQPRLRKSLGPSVQEAVRALEGPDYDLSRGLDVE
jgi:hypothetical protein